MEKCFWKQFDGIILILFIIFNLLFIFFNSIFLGLKDHEFLQIYTISYNYVHII